MNNKDISMNVINNLADFDYKRLTVCYYDNFPRISFDNPITVCYNSNSLREGIILTYPPEVAIRHIRTFIDEMDDWQIKTYSRHGNYCIEIIFPNIKNNKEHVDRALSACGYFCATTLNIFKDNRNNEWLRCMYQPSNEENVTNYVRNNVDYLYHISPKYNEKKILYTGIHPTHKNSVVDYPYRSYFLLGSVSESDVELMTRNLWRANDSIVNDGKYVIYKIDLSKVGSGVDFYEDLDCDNSVYTYSVIPSDAIFEIGDINIMDKHPKIIWR